jgi:hypothetical protein
MRLKNLYAALLFVAVSNTHAADGLGNVKFKMTMKQVEKLGYVCSPNPNKEGAFRCQNIEFQNSIYGYTAKDYRVLFGPDKKIYGISANLAGVKSMEDYFDFLGKMEVLFPIEDEGDSQKGVFVRHVRRDASNTGASFMMAVGTPGIVPTLYSISYFSPAYMAAIDQQRKVDRSKEQSSDAAQSN